MTLLPDITRSFASDLALHGDRPALVDPRAGATVTYLDLQRRVDDAAERLGHDSRRLVLLEVAATADVVAMYLAALQHGHPVLLAPAGRPSALRDLVDAYDPDVVVCSRSADVDERRRHAAHELHPDLALLLSTSGSSGSSKVVRLSAANLQANADAIATVLDIHAEDRAITSLPMAYCYGLSVLHSHLARGASLVLSEASVVDDEFWQTFRVHGAASFAGVPHTFDLLDRIGFDRLDLPSLRRITQAGGRLEPSIVRRYAELGRARGWDLHVMYGQTEATARMASLPPDLAASHPWSIGRAVPGGRIELDLDFEAGAATSTGDVGELVFRGPNVMLGYAHGPADLATGGVVDELRTGDLARVDDDGLFEIVGRRHRFVKPFGLRIDLDGVERTLRRGGVEAAVGGDDRRVVIATTALDRDLVAASVGEHTGLPPAAVDVHVVPAVPRLDNGKPDHVAVLALHTTSLSTSTGGGVQALYRDVLRIDDVRGLDTFASVGGDSLSYVELAVRLEELLGTLPDDWPVMTVDELDRIGASGLVERPRLVRWVESTVALRAAAVALVVATHAGLTDLRGGAHLLLAIAGWNFARFQLPAAPRRLATSVGRILVPTLLWLGLLLVLTDDYQLHNLLLLHSQIGPEPWSPQWRYWFVEALVPILVVVGGVLCVPAVRRLEQRRPFVLAAAVFALTLVVTVPAGGDRIIHRPQTIVWIFALGWLAQRASSVRQRVAVSIASAFGARLFFVDPEREGVLIVGMLVLLWVRTVPVVAPLHRIAGVVAGASLWTYLVHWQVYPTLVERATPAIATVASVAAGVAVHALYASVGRMTKATRASELPAGPPESLVR